MLPSAKSGVMLRPALSSYLPRSTFEIACALVGFAAVLVGAWSAVSAGAAYVSGVGFELPIRNDALVAGPTFSGSATHVPLHGASAASTTVENGIVPVRIDIDAIGVHAKVQEVGKNAKGEMAAPSDYKTVAWYAPGTRPGAPGSAAFAGHLNNSLSSAGVFANLDKLRVGDLVVITDAQGKKRTFSIIASEIYPADQPPDELIFATYGPSHVALITCDGAWNKGKKSYDERLVMFAKLVQ